MYEHCEKSFNLEIIYYQTIIKNIPLPLVTALLIELIFEEMTEIAITVKVLNSCCLGKVCK